MRLSAYMKETCLTQFTDLGLNAQLLPALANKGYTHPTPIQLAAIPGVMAGSDLLGIAQTGTGKTAAFALPILHRLAANRRAAPRRGCRALVLSPTRELATQIADSFRVYGAELGVSVATIFGGVSHGPQRQALARGIDVIVAAPGRLLDHLAQKDADLSSTEILVLDEADQMLDMGFIDPIRRIVRQLPHKRQNLFFSATMPPDIEKLASELLKEPLKVSVAPPATTVERISQQVVFVEAARKRGLLAELFANPDFSRVLVFTRTKRGADKVARILDSGGVSSAAIHGNKSQAQREKSLAAFRAGSIRALVATDIAARGIDVASVSHVVQFELPDVPEQYVHRIGRTARAGRDGSAVAFCAEDERPLLRDIERVTRQKIPSSDRRNDAALAELSAAAGASERGSASDEAALAGKHPRNQRSHARGGGRNGRRMDSRVSGSKPEGAGGEPRSGRRQGAGKPPPAQNRSGASGHLRNAAGSEGVNRKKPGHEKRSYGSVAGQERRQDRPPANSQRSGEASRSGRHETGGALRSAGDLIRHLAAKT